MTTKKSVLIRLEQSVIDVLARLASDNDRTVNNYIVNLIGEHVRKSVVAKEVKLKDEKK